jgi:hypothetical protein
MSDETPLTHYDIIYKLGALETLVTEGLKNINKSLTELSSTVKDNHTVMGAEVQKLEERVKALEIWINSIKARISLITAGAVALWAILGDTAKTILAKVF